MIELKDFLSSKPDIDEDVRAALQMIVRAQQHSEVGKVRKKQRERDEAAFETQLELLSDRVEQVIPKDNPQFPFVLLLAVMNKLYRAANTEPEYKSALEFPQGW